MARVIINELNQVFRSSFSAVLPDKLIRNTVKYNSINELLTIDGETHSLRDKNVYLVGTGKAVQSMAREMENILGSKLNQGIVSIPVGSLTAETRNNTNLKYYEGAKNNLPDSDAQDTAIRITTLVNKLSEKDVLLVLISGGGSALLPLPKGDITLKDKTQLIKDLATSGADITEINTVRKRVSDLKGGQLAAMALPAEVIALVLSDIVGDPLDLIASGPTIKNKDKPNAAIDIIKKYNLYENLPNSMAKVLETNYEPIKFLENKVKNYIIGSNKSSIKSAVKELRSLNYFPIPLSNKVTGDVKDIAQKYVKLARLFCMYINGNLYTELKQEITSLNIPGLDEDILDGIKTKDGLHNVCLVLGGEITVEVKGSGIGGRNQQLALEFSSYIHEVKNQFANFEVYILSAGTDGIDGPTDAAGAIGYLNLIADSKKDNIDVYNYLLNNDSYNFYKTFKNGHLHVITGHTNTNVMDIHLILLKKKDN